MFVALIECVHRVRHIKVSPCVACHVSVVPSVPMCRISMSILHNCLYCMYSIFKQLFNYLSALVLIVFLVFVLLEAIQLLNMQLEGNCQKRLISIVLEFSFLKLYVAGKIQIILYHLICSTSLNM